MQRTEVTTTIELDTEKIADLFDLEFDGWCPICKTAPVNTDEMICCNCFQIALTYHINMCGCYP